MSHERTSEITFFFFCFVAHLQFLVTRFHRFLCLSSFSVIVRIISFSFLAFYLKLTTQEAVCQHHRIRAVTKRRQYKGNRPNNASANTGRSTTKFVGEGTNDRTWPNKEENVRLLDARSSRFR